MKKLLALMMSVVVPLTALARGGDFDYSVSPLGVQQLLGGTDLATVAVRQPDGKYVVVSNGPLAVTLTRHLKDGTLDPAFGLAGTATFTRVTGTQLPSAVIPLVVKSVLIQPDGKILLAGEATAACGTIGLARLEPDGSSDRGFGTNGWSAPLSSTVASGSCSDGRDFTLAQVRLMGDGKVMAAGYPRDPLAAAATGTALVGRWLANGAPDTAYGTDGFVRPIFQWIDHPGGATIADTGAVELVHSQQAAAPSPWVLVSTRLAPDGRTREDSPLAVPDDLRMLPGVAFGRPGVRFVHTRATGTAGEVSVVRVKADGTTDAGFGTSGRVRVPFPANEQVVALLPTPEGGALLVVSAVEPPNDAVHLAKLDAIGALEPSFGSGGRLEFSSSPLSEYARQVGMGADGYLDFFGYTVSRVANVLRYNWYFSRVQAVPDVVEFENTDLKHYFIGYDDAEARGIDAGQAGPGWRRTGNTFRPGGTTGVCRFYGTPGRGPNSHFYTADPDECAQVKLDPGWTYEGTGFYVSARTTGIRCPQGLFDVFRLYNNRASQNDSNHRFLGNSTLIPEMVARGWTYEGIPFCVIR